MDASSLMRVQFRDNRQAFREVLGVIAQDGLDNLVDTTRLSFLYFTRKLGFRLRAHYHQAALPSGVRTIIAPGEPTHMGRTGNCTGLSLAGR